MALLVYHVDLRRLGAALFEVELDLLVLGVALQLAVIWLKSMKWGLVLKGATGSGVRRVFCASVIGAAANLILPARLGEIARISTIRNHNPISVPVALTTLVLTQLFDALVLAAYFLGISMWATIGLEFHRWKVMLVGGIGLVLLVSLTWGVRQHGFLRLSRAVLRGLPESLALRLNGYLKLFMDGICILGQNHLVGQVMLLTMAAWIVETGAAYALLLAFHIDATVSMAAVLVTVLNIGFAIPMTPGNLGVTQGLCVLVLGTFGVEQALAWSYAVGAPGILYFIVLGLGGIFFCREGMHLTELRAVTLPMKPNLHPGGAA